MPSPLIAELLASYAELKHWLLHRLGNPHDAADIAQSSFERVFAYADATPVDSPRALMFRTARGLCIDQARRRQIEIRVLEALGHTTAQYTPSAERAAIDRELLERLVTRLARLPAKRRDTFVLVRVYGHTHAEAAAHLRISVAAVEKHVVRATLDCSDLFAD